MLKERTDTRTSPRILLMARPKHDPQALGPSMIGRTIKKIAAAENYRRIWIESFHPHRDANETTQSHRC
jgi:hypothetical protein